MIVSQDDQSIVLRAPFGAGGEISVPGSKSISNRALLLAALSSGQTELEGLTFKDALQACIEAAGSGDLQTAASLFQSLELTFGAEDEYLEGEVQRRILPLKGLAELGAGQFEQAADTLDSLEASYPQALEQNAALL